jgi:hypothetical protein
MRFDDRKGNCMKSRLAVVMVLALSIFMSGTGAALAVSGSSGSGSASGAQYPEESEKNKICDENGGPGCEQPCEEGVPGSETNAQGECEHQAMPATPSSGGGGGSLPYTGFLTIPVLLVGIGLLGAGVAMRFRARSGEQY